MLSIQLHGIPRVARPGQDEVPLSAREAGLLAWLHLEGPSPRARLAGLLWPEGDETKARANLRQTLRRLRRSVGEVLAESDGVLSLAPGVTVVDGALECAVQPGAARLLGPLEFDDAPGFAEWLQVRREAAERERRRRLLARARQHRDLGEWDAALAAAEAVLAVDSAVEDAHRLRMEVFHLRGDRAAAVTAWDDCRDALRRAYGIAPSAATNELGRQVLAAEAAGLQQARGAPPRNKADALPPMLRNPPQLVGREAVLDDIARAFALGRGVVLAGPGGIGKSRVLAQAAARMEPALVVGARPGDELQPGILASRLVTAAVERFAPELDRRTRADIARLLPNAPARERTQPSALEQRRVLASVARTMLACHAQGMRLVAVDDLQFADDLSMEAMAVVVGGWLAQPPDTAALPLLSCRADELRPAAAALVAMLAGSRLGLRIDLEPLSVHDLQRLLGSLPLQAADAPGATLDHGALARALHERVGGNPAFVLESVRSLWLEGLQAWRPGQALRVPATLRESLRQRLARLSPDALQLAQLAAVAQEDFSLALAAAATGRAALALAPPFAELEAAQVLEGTRFCHDLVAEAACAALPSALVQALHQLVAEHLRTHTGAPARIAWHLQRAGAEVEAAPWHLAAAQAAQDRWQLGDAARHYEAAAQGLAKGPPGRGDIGSQASTWLQAARGWTAVSDYPAALAAIDRGLAAEPTPGERLELQASQVIVLTNSQRHAEAATHAQRLADALAQQPEVLPADRAAAALWACVAAVPYSPHPEATAALCEQLRERCRAGPPRARQSFALAVGTCSNWLAWPQRAQADLAQARALADDFGDHAAVVNVTHQQVRNALLLGDCAAARAAVADGRKAVEAGGFGRSFRLHAWAMEALVHLAAGQPAPLLAALQALDAACGTGDLRGEAETAAARALGWCFLGRADLAQAQTTEQPPGEGWWSWLMARRADAIDRRLQALSAIAQQWPAAQGAMGCRRRVLAAKLRPLDLPAAQALRAELGERGLLPLLRRADLVLARAALDAGAPELAVRHAQQALDGGVAIDPWTDEPAALWLDAAATLHAARATAQAEDALLRGRRWLREAALHLPAGELRESFLHGHPLHRSLAGP